MMLFMLIRKEILSHVLSLRFGITFILFILLVFASIYVTVNQYERDADEVRARNRAATADLEKMMGEPDPRSRFWTLFYHRGRNDAAPPPAMSSVVQGLRPAMPASVNTRVGSSRKIGRSLDTNPLAGLLPIPDLVYVVGVVLSLLSILFAFDSISGEKEAGTLRLVMSNAIPRASILLAKWLGGYLMLIVPFLIAVFGGLGYAWWRGSLPLTEDNLLRLGLLLGVACLYISVFFTLSLAVSSVTHRAPTSLFLCLLIWVVWILVIPNLAPVLAKIIVPGHSKLKVDQEKMAVRREYDLLKQRLTQVSGKLSYGSETEDEREELDDEMDKQLKRWDDFLSGALRRQSELAGTLGRISPSACWTYAAVALADVGPNSYKKFDEAADRLQKEMRQAAEHIGNLRTREDPKEFTLAAVPSLRVKRTRLHEAAQGTLNDILILAVLNIALFMMAFICFLRYDVR